MTHDQIFRMCATTAHAILEDTVEISKWAANRKFLWKRVLANGEPSIIVWNTRRDLYTRRDLPDAAEEFEAFVRGHHGVPVGSDVVLTDNTAGPVAYALLRNEVVC